MASNPRSKSTRQPGTKAAAKARAVRAAVKKPQSRAKPAGAKAVARIAAKKPAGRVQQATRRGATTARKLTAKTGRSAAKSPVATRAPAKKPTTSRKAARATKPAATAQRPRKPRATAVASPAHSEGPSAVEIAAREKELAREHASTAVNRALSLLEAMALSGPVPLAVLADVAGCGKAAALELLTTMQTRNFVIQEEADGVWRLGARWAVLGSAANEQGALAATAMPYLAALGNATGENVYLRVREGMECETVAIYQTDPGLRVYTEVGKKMPLHAGSGRLLLAHAPEAVQTQVLAQRLQRYTPSTRIDPSWIAADLHRIRTRGFLITDSEVVAGTVSVCAPVRDASGQVVAAILIGAPSLRMRPPRPRALLPAVLDAARKLSYALGSISEQPAPEPEPSSMEARPVTAFTSSAWPSTALGADIARPHSIFR